MNTTLFSKKCLSIQETLVKSGFCRTSLYLILADESMEFPRPLIIGRRRFFLENEIDDWIANRPRVASKTKKGT
jgi:predicted DNA-binding transcriptional regulator AlpA